MIPPPRIEQRDWDGILQDLLERTGGYVPEWQWRADQPGGALLRIFARYMSLLGEGINRVPERTRLAFLDRMGTDLLPAKPASVPLVFKLLDNCPIDVSLPAHTQVAAPASAVLPSSLGSEKAATAPQAILFATMRAITLARAKLSALYSIDPAGDVYADHSARWTDGFLLFESMAPIPHELYCGHDVLFALVGKAEVILSFDMAPASAQAERRGVLLDWEYLSEDGWLPLVVTDDTTSRFTQDGKITLVKDCGPDAKQGTIHGRQSYWLRGRVRTTPPSAIIQGCTGTQLTLDAAWPFLVGDRITVDGESGATILDTFGPVVLLDQTLLGAQADKHVRLASDLPPLRPEGSDTAGVFPRIDRIIARVGFSKGNIAPERAFQGSFLLDTENHFHPFGQQPAPFATFYLACREVFQRAGARIQIDAALARVGESTDVRLDWEYYSQSGWVGFAIPFPLEDETAAFTKNGGITFISPADWKLSKVNGEENFWLRCRIREGSYGRPFRIKVETKDDLTMVTAVESTLQPPIVAKLSLQYTFYTNSLSLDHCVSANGFVMADHTDDCLWPRRTFEPFHPIEDREPAIHFGFDRELPTGLISLYVDVPDEASNDASQPNMLVWEYRSTRGWTELGVLDDTRSFRHSGLIQWIGPSDAVATSGVGGNLYRIRARLQRGARMLALPVSGIWMNAVQASQRNFVAGDLLGSSDGTADQSFQFLRLQGAILEGEVVEVLEWVGRGDNWETAVIGVAPDDLNFVRDPATRQVREVWVRWHGTTRLHACRSGERVYVVERSLGMLRFGDDGCGRIPPAGSQIRVSYSSGGGSRGNVSAGAIRELRSGVPYVQEAWNPVAAAGGAEIETIAAAGARGPQRLRHHDRGVSAADLEWLALEASAGVARVRCLPLTGNEGHAQRGWFTLIVVPHGEEARPMPTAELVRGIHAHLIERVPAGTGGRIRIVPPSYAPVSIAADIVPKQPDEAVRVEERVRDRLRAFLHPLTGGTLGNGWDFGESLYLSTIARLIEETPGVDYPQRIQLSVASKLFDEVVSVDQETLICFGDPELKLMIGVD